MRRSLLTGIVVAACLVGGGGAAQARSIAWSNSLTQAISAAKKTDKLVMIDFYADWCGYCKKLDAETYTDPTVIQVTSQVIPVKLNSEREGLQAARKYRIMGLPTILFINAAGGVEGRIGGYEPAAPFVKAVNYFVQQHKQLPVLEGMLRSHPTPELAARLTGTFAQQGDQAKATQMLAQVERLDPSGTKGCLVPSMINIGHMYQDAGAFDRALLFYRRSLKLAKSPSDRAFSHLCIALWNLQQNKLDAAVPELKAVNAMPQCPSKFKTAADNLLTRVEQFKSSGR